MQGQNAFTRSQGGLPIGDEISFNSGVHSVADIPLHDQLSCGNDYALKVVPEFLCVCGLINLIFTFVTVSTLF